MTEPLIRPFVGFIPAADVIERVIAPPVSSITTDRYEQLVVDNPESILHLLGSAIDTGEGGADPSLFDGGGGSRLAAMIDAGVFEPQPPAFYLLAIDTGESTHTGIVCDVNTAGMEDGRIKRHEDTRADTEELVVEHLNIVGAHTDPVAMTYRSRPDLRAAVQAIASGRPPLREFVAADGSTQRLWAVVDSETLELLEQLVSGIAAVYITDGHHRTAAATRLRRQRAAANPGHVGNESYNYLPAVLFAEDELLLHGYNRAVMDIGELTPSELVERIGRVVDVEEISVAWAEEARPRIQGVVSMLLDGRWYRLRFRDQDEPTDARGALDAVRLQNLILGPILGIADARADSRLHYIPGTAGLAELEYSGAAVAFALHAASVTDVMAVADEGSVMPPKSTWFEPKIMTGLVVKKV